jgi:hypothetical protein
MADQHDHPPNRIRTAPPPFVGPPRAGAITPKARTDRPTLPPFSPPFVKRPSPAVPAVREEHERAPSAAPAAALPARRDTMAPSWLNATPNEPAGAPEAAIEWVNPDAPAAAAPAQAPTGIDWLDAPPLAGPSAPMATSKAPLEDADDVFGWDPAEERGATLDAAPTAATLDALKELEPWALPGSELSGATSEDIAAALERVAARIRSGDLFVPGAPMAATDEAVLASVLAALLQSARG